MQHRHRNTLLPYRGYAVQCDSVEFGPEDWGRNGEIGVSSMEMLRLHWQDGVGGAKVACDARAGEAAAKRS